MTLKNLQGGKHVGATNENEVLADVGLFVVLESWPFAFQKIRLPLFSSLNLKYRSIQILLYR